MMSGMGGADSACPAEEFDGYGRGLNPSFREDRLRELFPLPRAPPLQCDSSYSQEDFVSTVRPYQRDLISLPETGDDPVSLDQVLDEHGRQVLGDPLRTMLLSDEEWGEVLEKGDLVRPYMDVRLQHDQQLYTSFIQDLHAKGMISFTSRPRR